MTQPPFGMLNVLAAPNGTVALPPGLGAPGIHAIAFPGAVPGAAYVWILRDGVLELWDQQVWRSNEASALQGAASLAPDEQL